MAELWGPLSRAAIVFLFTAAVAVAWLPFYGPLHLPPRDTSDRGKDTLDFELARAGIRRGVTEDGQLLDRKADLNSQSLYVPVRRRWPSLRGAVVSESGNDSALSCVAPATWCAPPSGRAPNLRSLPGGSRRSPWAITMMSGAQMPATFHWQNHRRCAAQQTALNV